MRIGEFSIRRHVLTWVMSSLLVLAGVLAYQNIGVDRYPNIEQPIISVSTSLSGASPDVIDKSVTEVLESSLNSVPGLDSIASTSSTGRSSIRLTFVLEKDIEVAFNEVQAKISQVTRRLPEDADPPVVSKADANASPVMWLSLKGDRTRQQLYEYANETIKKQLETVDGVGEIWVRGRGQRVIRVELEPLKLARYQITAQDIRSAFRQNHLQMAGGYLTGEAQEFLLDLNFEQQSLSELKNIVIRWRDGGAIRLQDVAHVIDGETDLRNLSRVNGETTINLGIVRISNSNTVALTQAIRQRLEHDIIPNLPAGMRLDIVTDDSSFVLEMMQALQDHLIEGTILAALVVWLFLRNWRSTLIVAVAIPVSLLGAVALMAVLGYTFNTITLLALLLLIGVVVDDAIVVVENVYRHREAGQTDAVQAAIDGSQEVVFAVIAATFSLVAIFLPVLLLTGTMARLFSSFAVVVSFGVLVSLFVAVTLTPMLSSRYLREEKQHGVLYRRLEAAFLTLERWYRAGLVWSLAHKAWILGVSALVVALSYLPATQMKSEFLPEEDESRFMVNLRLPIGGNFARTDAKSKEVEAVLLKIPEVRSVLAIVGGFGASAVNQTNFIVRLHPKEARQRSQQAVLADIRKKFASMTGARVSAFPFPRIGESRGGRLQFAVVGINRQEVGRYAEQLQKRLSADPKIGRLDLDLDLRLPTVFFKPKHLALAQAGLSARDLAETLNLLSAGSTLGQFSEANQSTRHNVRLKASDTALFSVADLGQIYLRNAAGELIRLDAVADIHVGVGPTQIERYNRLYSATLKASPPVPLSEAMARVEEVAAEVLPPSYRIEKMGEVLELERSGGQIWFVFGLASLLLYMVLASQFNSFSQPILIMLAEPLALVGGLYALWLMGHGLHVYSVIGLLLLVGLVAKNAILLVDVTNQTRAKGLDIEAALLSSCPLRLRPVLMTSLTVILAMFPAALGLGAGAETNAPLAVAVIGGMLGSTFLTLFVVPVAYDLLENWKLKA